MLIHNITTELQIIAPFVIAISSLISAIKSNQSLKKLKYETSNNGGGSLKDQIDKIMTRLEIDEQNTIQYRSQLDKRLALIESNQHRKNTISKKQKH